MAGRLILPREEYKDLVEKVLNRDGHKCRSCGSRRNLAAHHIIFRSDSGPDASWNLCTLCNDKCHLAVHGRLANNFIIILAKDGDEDTIPNADEGLTFRRQKQVTRRVRWRVPQQ